MFDQLKNLLKHSAIYSISNVATKFIGVILLPLYTSYISLAEFGILGLIDVTILIGVELFNFGISQSLLMFNNSKEYEADKKRIFFTLTLISLLICALAIPIFYTLIPVISNNFLNSTDYSHLFTISIFVIVFKILNNLFLNKLRADEKSVTYTIINMIRLILTLSLIIFYVAFKGQKVEGVVNAYIISEALVFLVQIPIAIRQMETRFKKDIISVSFRFGFPLIFGTLAMMLLNVSDRYIINYFTDSTQVGLYDLGYRFAGILNMFVTIPFGLTFLPVAYRIYGEKGDIIFFSKVLTYLTMILVWLGLSLALFSREIIKIFALDPSYWPAHEIVPIILLSYVFFGMKHVTDIGLFLRKNTKYVAYNIIIAAIINITLNIVFLQVYGMKTAAYTTLISFFILLLGSYYLSRKSYKISYEIIKITKLVFLGIVFFLIGYYLESDSLIGRIAVKSLLIIGFPLLLFFLSFFNKNELKKLKELFNKFKITLFRN